MQGRMIELLYSIDVFALFEWLHCFTPWSWPTHQFTQCIDVLRFINVRFRFIHIKFWVRQQMSGQNRIKFYKILFKFITFLYNFIQFYNFKQCNITVHFHLITGHTNNKFHCQVDDIATQSPHQHATNTITIYNILWG